MTNAENRARAVNALRGLDGYVEAAYGDDDAEDLDTALADLLGDLRHLADREGLDFEDCSMRGAENYVAEVGE